MVAYYDEGSSENGHQNRLQQLTVLFNGAALPILKAGDGNCLRHEKCRILSREMLLRPEFIAE